MSFSLLMSKRTRQREAIRAAVEAADRPLSPQEILEAARQAVPRLGLATVYRTLSLLVAEGWIETVEALGEGRRYERAGKGHHHHYHCCDCDRVFDLEGCAAPTVEASVPAGFTVLGHELLVRGRCADCAEAS
jgi:Fur family ferric uptake transcriptional regulator